MRAAKLGHLKARPPRNCRPTSRSSRKHVAVPFFGCNFLAHRPSASHQLHGRGAAVPPRRPPSAQLLLLSLMLVCFPPGQRRSRHTRPYGQTVPNLIFPTLHHRNGHRIFRFPLLICLDRLPTLTSVVFPKSHALLTLLTHPFRPDQKHPLFSASRPTPPRPVAADSRVASSRHLLHPRLHCRRHIFPSPYQQLWPLTCRPPSCSSASPATRPRTSHLSPFAFRLSPFAFRLSPFAFRLLPRAALTGALD
jgi:hypothetical protein